MYCPECDLTISYAHAPKLEVCTLCGVTMCPSATDVLQDGRYGIAREVRPTQVELANDIEVLLRQEDGVALLEGGTGIGKSFAYLIPVILRLKYAIDHDEPWPRTVIATAKKTLQDQLARKDVPLLVEKILGTGTPANKYVTVYKGRSNYACWVAKEGVPKKDRGEFARFIERARSKQQPAELADWAGKPPSWWSGITVEHCTLGNSCSHRNMCKPNPAVTPIVITNHHLVAFDAYLRGILLGDFDILIVDEAHQFSEAFRSAFTKKATVKSVARIKQGLNSEPFREALEIRPSETLTMNYLTKGLKVITTQFERLVKRAGQIKSNDNAVEPAKLVSEVEDVRESIGLVIAPLVAFNALLIRAHSSISRGDTSSGEDMSLGKILAARSANSRLQRGLSSVTKLCDAIENIVAEKNSNNLVTAEQDGLSVRPIEVGPTIRDTVTAKHQMFLSATLALNGSFSYAHQEFGINPKEGFRVEKVYPSPFDLSGKNVLLYTPKDIPPPAHAGAGIARDTWLTSVCEHLKKIVVATHGFAFVLFSARTDMNAVADAISWKFWEDNKLHLVIQDGDATAVLRRYHAKPGGVLFGLKSFWEGVDVPGDRLRAVIIPKLPFPYFGDPLLKARERNIKARGGNPFYELQVPQMIFDMKQGTGRLIRTKKDRGIIAILDPRIWTGASNAGHKRQMFKIQRVPGMSNTRFGYGKLLFDTLGFPGWCDDIRVVEKFAANRFGK